MSEKEKPKVLRQAIGLMSGTSMDGVDAALITTSGDIISGRGPFISIGYEETFRKQLKNAVARAHRLPIIPCTDEEIGSVADRLTRIHADAVAALLDAAGMGASDVDVLGFHGHTVDHRPSDKLDGAPGATWQIGDGALLAELTGIDVVADFRSNDVAHGGQGAPLLPFYHRAIANDSHHAGEAGEGSGGPVAILNIGGVANVTWIGFGIGAGEKEGAPMVAFDTGPGNALIDDWVLENTGQRYDAGGTLALSGKVSEPVLKALLDNPYFDRPPPKSLDRDDFDYRPCEGLSAADGAATLTAFTEQAVVAALALLPEPPTRWYVTGGGRHNACIMAGLGRLLGVPVASVEALGLDGDAVEAEAFAMMAVRCLEGQPVTYPGTTGAPRPLTGGVIFQAPD